MSKLQT